MKNNVFIVSNAIDDATRKERKITTDSPAASRKVFMWANLLSSNDAKVTVVSLGRGKADGTFSFFKSKVIKKKKAAVIYLPFSHVKYLSELITFFTLPLMMLYLYRRSGNGSVIFYNRHPAYIAGAIASYFTKLRCFIDLEDGEVINRTSTLKSILQKLMVLVFEKVCRHGAILACSALERMTSIKPTLCYYGYVDNIQQHKRFNKNKIHFLLSGTIDESTGVAFFCDVLQQLNSVPGDWKNKIVFEVCGQGSGLQQVKDLSVRCHTLDIRVHGRLSNNEYHDLLVRSDVGFALKPVGGDLADTTFPSKVIEYATYGMLVITTDISDVRKVLGNDGAYFLKSMDPNELAGYIVDVAINKDKAISYAATGAATSLAATKPDTIRKKMYTLLFPESQARWK